MVIFSFFNIGLKREDENLFREGVFKKRHRLTLMPCSQRYSFNSGILISSK